jgi:hypothetical protein
MPSARRVASWSLAVVSISGAISVGVGEGDSGWDADSPGLMIAVSIGVRAKGVRLDGGVEKFEGSAVRLEIDGDGGIVGDALAAG